MDRNYNKQLVLSCVGFVLGVVWCFTSRTMVAYILTAFLLIYVINFIVAKVLYRKEDKPKIKEVVTIKGSTKKKKTRSKSEV